MFSAAREVCGCPEHLSSSTLSLPSLKRRCHSKACVRDYVRNKRSVFQLPMTKCIRYRESDPVDDETNEDEDNNNNESSKGPSNADAFSALETTMEWYE
ncbi:hypothetical protein TNCV_1808711 [Trichonephila clavipes]|nr:hypothetical protein TNCV_1808711 [Trichonephila clavipes]